MAEMLPKALLAQKVAAVAVGSPCSRFFSSSSGSGCSSEQKYRDSLQKGDKVVTIGGFHGKITEVKETTVMISLAPGMEVEVEKTALVKDGTRVGQA